jgi:uracil-DNA glycosylase
MDDDPRAELANLAASLRAYLEWQRQTGALGFPRRSASATVPAAAPSVPATMAIATAATISNRDVRLPQLAEEVSTCTKCGLAKTRTQAVFARGNPGAHLCFVGEAPGAEEDAQGLPFVGRAGQLLDRMIAAMGLSPERDVYVCNILKCRPPGNRRPEPEEIAACIPHLHEQLALVRPRVIVALGNTAVAALLDSTAGITRVRGQWKLYQGQTLVMPTYHPSYLLRPGPQQLEAKRQAWEDLQLVMKELGVRPPDKRG